ncbi:MAG: hypothetical protein QOJ87_2368 [Verrucomicrobiota bacterium]
MDQLTPDLNVRRSTTAILVFEALLAVPFVLGLGAALRQSAAVWTLFIPVALMVGFWIHHRSFALRINEGVLVYREPFRAITRIPLGEVETAYIAGWITYQGKNKLPKKLVVIPKRSSSIPQFDINLTIFDNRDMAQLLECLPMEKSERGQSFTS